MPYPLIDRFYQDLLIKGSGTHKKGLFVNSWMLKFRCSQIEIYISLELKCFSKNLTPLKETYLGGTWDILVIDKMSQGRTNARVMMCIKKDSVSCRE